MHFRSASQYSSVLHGDTAGRHFDATDKTAINPTNYRLETAVEAGGDAIKRWNPLAHCSQAALTLAGQMWVVRSGLQCGADV